MATRKLGQSASLMTFDKFRDLLVEKNWPHVREGRELRIYCPIHGGGALTASDGEGKLLAHCFACDVSDTERAGWFRGVIEGIRDGDPPAGYRFSPNGHRAAINWDHPEATYEYRDAEGNPYLRRTKYIVGTREDGTTDKVFTWSHHLAGGGWMPDLAGYERIPYRLPELLAAEPWEPVYVVEGEKDADGLAARGHVATTAGGANDWLAEFAQYFEGRHVILVPDRDEPGQAAAERIIVDLLPVAGLVQRIDLDEFPVEPKHGRDVSDWYDLYEGLPEATTVTGVGIGTPTGVGIGTPTGLGIGTPTFPIETLPQGTRKIVEKLAEGQDMSIDYVGMQALGVASGAIGTTVSCRIAKLWKPQPANLFIALVGPPGSGKTEAGWQLRDPIYRRQDELDAKFHEDLEAAGAEAEKAKVQRGIIKAQYEAECKAAIKNHTELPPVPDELTGKAVEQPHQTHVWTESSTVERIADALELSPRGLMVIPDELAKLWLGMNKYSGGQGNDKQHFLEAWNAGRWRIKRADRKKDKVIPKAWITIFGGIQPDLLQLIRGDYDDGTLERWLYAWPDVTWLADAPKEFDDTFLGAWDTYIAKLYDLVDSYEVCLDAAATAEHDQFYAMVQDRWGSGEFRGFNGKAGQYWSRLALVLHALKWAEGDAQDFLWIDGESARGATALMDYFYGMAKKVWSAIGDQEGVTSRDVTGGAKPCGCIGSCTDACRARRYRQKRRG